jgi:two-component system cell cycle sensor histidine kinase/response regulator CckA
LQVHQIELELQNEELRRAQMELDAARARYFDLYDLAPVGYVTITDKGLIAEANLTAASMLQVARSALLMQPLTRFVLKEEQDVFYQNNRHLFESREPQAYELQMVKVNGAVFWARLEVNASRDADGAPACRVVVSDISAAKRAEKEREALQTQLLQSQKMEMVGQLAGGIAHDFNNILAAIIMQLDLLRIQPNVERDTLLETVDELLASAHRAAHLTQQLLLFSRRQPLKTSRQDANTIVLGLTQLLERLLGEHVTLDVDLYPEPLWIEGDASMITQVAMNLCVNARDAMPEGGRLTIATRPVVLDPAATERHRAARPGPYIWLRVSDTGCGMEPAIMERIFEPFFTTKAPGKGSGIGLATVDGIVTTHGGFVEAESQPGKGSTFSVYLPRVEYPNATEEHRDATSLRGGNERILVVEDEPYVRRSLTLCLRQLGYGVTEAVNGPEALKIWERERGNFDLLFTDMVMPGGLSGLDLCSRLRERKAGLKAVVSSGYSAEMVDDKKAIGRNITYLLKPYSVNTLAATVRACLDS